MSLFDQLDAWLARLSARGSMRGARRYLLDAIPEATRGRVAGVVRPLDGRVLEAPLSGRSCVYHAIEIHDRRASSERLIATEQRSIPFLLEDATGRAVVDPEHARFLCAFDHGSQSKAAFDADPRQRALLGRFELVHRDWWNTTQLRYRESVIAVDEPITVVGMGVREPDPDGPPSIERGYREAGPTRMYFTGTAKHPLLLLDDPRLA
ncbi:MAG: GIDE domain-containing protein [Kofleriaceae bacterium]